MTQRCRVRFIADGCGEVGLPEDEIATMLGGSAAAFYGIDSEKLAPLVARIGPPKSLFVT